MNTPRFLTILLLIALTFPVSVFGDVTDEEIGRAISSIKKYLYYKQDRQTGSWEFRSNQGGVESDVMQVGGETALVTEALLISGESFQNPRIEKALKYLREVEMKGTYAVAFRAHVWAQLPPEYMPLLEFDASWLLEAANKHQRGLFDYQPLSSDRVDHSVTQYGMLGLWEASKRGLKIPDKYWMRWAEHFVSAQKDDGGWSYSSNPDGLTTGSMTAAGLTALFICQQELYRDRPTPESKVTQAIDKGVAWLDQRFVGHNNPNANEWIFYYLYGIERVALSSGLRYFNQQDWYQAGATHILNKLDDNGSIDDDYVDTAFALMFLSRGRVPVWANKLQVKGSRWNNYPNDVFTLSRYLSEQVEKEINWQIIQADLPGEDWLVAPVTYLASNEALNIDDKQKRNLKRYLDLGGLLLTSPDGDSKPFTDSVRALAKELYPQYEPTELPSNHMVYSCWHHIAKERRLPLGAVSNGARELIIMADRDWGQVFQSDKNPGKNPAWDLATNIFAYATNRGALSNRLDKPYEKRTGRGFSGEVSVGRASYAGNWLPEPGAWEVQANYVFNQAGINVKTTPGSGAGVLSLDDIGQCDHKLVHLTGTHAINLTETQKKAIRQYVGRGGTILIETVSGHGGFSRGLEKQLSEMFNVYAVPLTPADPIISGAGLNGGQDCARALYRRYAVVTVQYDPKPNLAALLDQSNRPIVIISHEDLSLGMIGNRFWNIIGYQPESSRRLVANIVLWAKQQQMIK